MGTGCVSCCGCNRTSASSVTGTGVEASRRDKTVWLNCDPCSSRGASTQNPSNWRPIRAFTTTGKIRHNLVADFTFCCVKLILCDLQSWQPHPHLEKERGCLNEKAGV